MYLLKHFSVFILLIVGSSLCFGRDNYSIPKSSTDSINSYPLAYQIKIPGTNLGNGYYSLMKLHNVRRVPQKDILPNKVLFKTKSSQPKSKELVGNQILSNSNMTNIKIKNIRQPFAKKTISNLLSNTDGGLNRIYEITYEGNSDVYEICKNMMKDPEIEYAEPVYLNTKYDFTTNDVMRDDQHYLDLIHANEAWEVTQGDTNVVIAVVDDAVQWDHPDLLKNIWFNKNEIPDNGIDDDNNGKLDDYHGWDFVGDFSYDNYIFVEDNDPAPLKPSVDHGTHVSGCASAATNNQTGISGIGFNCKILPVKSGSDNPQIRNIVAAYEGVQYAVEMGADIINCSWGNNSASMTNADIIANALSHGTLIVAAGGNDGSDNCTVPHYPSSYHGVLAVGATNENDAPADFSNWGACMTVYSPGTEILSTVPIESYASFQGTSMASPITAGVAGLVKSVFPKYTPKQILHQIRSTCDNVITSNKSRPYFYGRINAFKAVTYNNSKFPNKKVPGCDVEQISFLGFDGIENFKPLKTKLKITNYLSATKDLKVTLHTLDDFIEVSDNEYYVGAINTLDSKDITVDVKLKPNCPWLQGEVRFIVEFNDGQYQDYSIISLPVFLEESISKFNTSVNYDPGYLTPIHFTNACAIRKNYAIFCGESYWDSNGAILYAESEDNSYDINANQNDCAYSITAVNVFQNTLYAASKNSEQSTSSILESNTQGYSWNKLADISFTPYINDLKVYPTNSALILGDPKEGKWGVGVAKNNLETFSQVTNIPAPMTAETITTGATCYKDSCVWFGTSLGRVFFSSDYGNSWTASETMSTQIIGLAFNDKNSGVVLSKIQGSNFPVFISNTSDGGKTWNLEINTFSTDTKYPVKMYAHPNGNQILQFYDGRISVSNDLGVNWWPIPAMETRNNIIYTAFCDDTSAQVWYLGDQILNLTFKMPTFKWNKKILVNQGKNLLFDTIEVGKNQKTKFDITNFGDAKVLLPQYIIEPGANTVSGEFKVMIGFSKMVGVDSTANFTIRFSPKSTGPKSATLLITNTSDSSIIRVPVIGYATDGASTVANAEESGMSASPNPAKMQCLLNFGGKSISKIQVNSNLGNQVFNTDIDENASEYLLNTTNYASGMYIVTMTCQSGAKYCLKLNIQK